MEKKSAVVDQYIEDAPDFARPVLRHIRKLVHQSVPDAEEAMKWGKPAYVVNGSIVCITAAFNHHCALVLWNASLLRDPQKILQLKDKQSAGHFGRITGVKDLPPPKVLQAYFEEAAGLARDVGKLPGKAAVSRKR